MENLKEVLTRIHGAQLKLSPKKCSLFQKEVQYLGHLVSESGVSMDPNKVYTVRDWPVPKLSLIHKMCIRDRKKMINFFMYLNFFFFKE